MEIALENVPSIAGKVYVMPDVSGSMHAAITGARGSATTDMMRRCCGAVRCRDSAEEPRCRSDALQHQGGAGRAQSARHRGDQRGEARIVAVRRNQQQRSTRASERAERSRAMVIYVSDNQSWVDAANAKARGTAMMVEWNRFKVRNAHARLVCIDSAECDDAGGRARRHFKRRRLFRSGVRNHRGIRRRQARGGSLDVDDRGD